MPFLNPLIRRLFAWAAVLPSLAAAAVAADPARLDFNRDVRPILAEHCLNCHGFDDRTRKGGLRLDRAEDALKGGKSGRPAIVPGKAAESELVKRLRTTDPDDRMPPEEKGVPLTDAQRATLERWVAEGGRISGALGLPSPGAAARAGREKGGMGTKPPRRVCPGTHGTRGTRTPARG